MEILKYRFRTDLLIWLIVVILVGSSLASGIGYLADNYFGDTVNSLMGDYGKYDFLLTVNQELTDSAMKEIKEVKEEKLPGSKLKKGITVAGTVNYFLQVDDKLRTKAVFSKVDNYFEEIIGVDNVSLMAEPKISLQGMIGDTKNFFNQKISKLSEVDFILPTGSGLNIILKQSADLQETTEQIEGILDDYRLLQIRFPIAQSPEEITELNLNLRQKLQKEFSSQEIQSLNSGQRRDLDDLIKTMTQMKKFLMEYATIVEAELPADLKVSATERFALASQEDGSLAVGDKITPETILLTPLQREDGLLQLIIKRGDGTEIGGQSLYLISQEGIVKQKFEVANIEQPRYLLQKAVGETKELVPKLASLVDTAEKVNQNFLNWLTEYRQGIDQIQGLQEELVGQQDKLTSIVSDGSRDLEQLRAAVNDISAVTTSLEESVAEMYRLREKLIEINSNFKGFERNLEKQVAALSLVGVEDERLTNLRDSVKTLQQKTDGEMDRIISRINSYNPLLNKLEEWNNNLKRVQQLLQAGSDLNLNSPELKGAVKGVVGDLDGIMAELGSLESGVKDLNQLNFKLIITELDHVQNVLPDLRDEEITGTIQLLDKYLAGQVVPGKELNFLVNQSVNQGALESKVEDYFAQQEYDIKQLFTAPGLLQPNVRGEFFRILGEVRAVLTAVIALVFTIFVLFMDQSLVMATIQRRNQQESNRLIKVLNSSYLYGFVLGGVVLSSIFYISQAKLPLLNLEYIFLIGSSLGMLAANKAGSINPLDEAEFLAGEALGLSYTEIMHEIVIPQGRPGVLTILNRRKMIFA
ncbi:hypothetical protein [Acetohalobium arabaticum]|uniref:Uncharacterized protein n=1 Tax=Acetohalobium arabaticum (strain ATCC 49924 / DSM 5501 / Z-7288) TaxID=574087 RepID=D9QTW0_ACEAZ|nr:hypothetical protein [Acetohalobium arabaticum]ADL13681.1 hypothetical protein Acear_2195 [Acetohalobium arabaticum DSM 5501]